jgi:HSP20 family protein
MDTNRIKEDFGSTWRWLAEGWRNMSAKAANALTYFSPGKSGDDESMRWGLLAVDVTEHKDHLMVELEAPGLDKEDIDVTVEDQRLIVTGTKRYESERTEGNRRITERAFGSFQRVIPLPDGVTAENAEAKYRRGVLTLKLPIRQPPGARKISVSSV